GPLAFPKSQYTTPSPHGTWALMRFPAPVGRRKAHEFRVSRAYSQNDTVISSVGAIWLKLGMPTYCGSDPPVMRIAFPAPTGSMSSQTSFALQSAPPGRTRLLESMTSKVLPV